MSHVEASRCVRRTVQRPEEQSRRYHQHAMARGLVLRPIGKTLYAMPPYVLDDEAVQCLASGALAALNATLQEEN